MTRTGGLPCRTSQTPSTGLPVSPAVLTNSDPDGPAVMSPVSFGPCPQTVAFSPDTPCRPAPMLVVAGRALGRLTGAATVSAEVLERTPAPGTVRVMVRSATVRVRTCV